MAESITTPEELALYLDKQGFLTAFNISPFDVAKQPTLNAAAEFVKDAVRLNTNEQNTDLVAQMEMALSTKGISNFSKEKITLTPEAMIEEGITSLDVITDVSGQGDVVLDTGQFSEPMPSDFAGSTTTFPPDHSAGETLTDMPGFKVSRILAGGTQYQNPYADRGFIPRGPDRDAAMRAARMRSFHLDRPNAISSGLGRNLTGGIEEVEPRYMVKSSNGSNVIYDNTTGETLDLQSQSVSVIAALQADLARAGFLDIGNVAVGRWDAITHRAFYSGLMDYSNLNPTQDWGANLSELVANPPLNVAGGTGSGLPEPALVYERPDMATLAADILQYAAARLGRRLAPEDLDGLAGTYRQLYDKYIESQIEHDAAVRKAAGEGDDIEDRIADALGTLGPKPWPDSVRREEGLGGIEEGSESGPIITDTIDPVARFQLIFDKLFNKEIEANIAAGERDEQVSDYNQRVLASVNSAQATRQTVSTIDDIIRRGF